MATPRTSSGLMPRFSLIEPLRSTGGTVLFEHDGITIHKDLQLGVSVQMHTGAQLLGQNDAAQRIDAADNSGTFHSIPFSFILFL